MSKIKNILSFLVASEFMFLGVELMYVVISLILNTSAGFVFSVIILMLSVGETAVGLGLCITALKLNKNINFDDFTNLKC
jgi:NADH:ubiquinone oxidoreductase subunit K